MNFVKGFMGVFNSVEFGSAVAVSLIIGVGIAIYCVAFGFGYDRLGPR